MCQLTQQQEQGILDALTALPWTRELETQSAQLIANLLECSAEDGRTILERLTGEGKIECVSESGGTPASSRELDSYGWSWIHTDGQHRR
jgi:hypothetical protein